MKMIVLASMVFTALLHLPALAQVYKWVDEKGNVHYSDRPQNLDAEQLDIVLAPPSDAVEDAAASTTQDAGNAVQAADATAARLMPTQ